jgi:hypothetical protein
VAEANGTPLDGKVCGVPAISTAIGTGHGGEYQANHRSNAPLLKKGNSDENREIIENSSPTTLLPSCIGPQASGDKTSRSDGKCCA